MLPTVAPSVVAEPGVKYIRLVCGYFSRCVSPVW